VPNIGNRLPGYTNCGSSGYRYLTSISYLLKPSGDLCDLVNLSQIHYIFLEIFATGTHYLREESNKNSFSRKKLIKDNEWHLRIPNGIKVIIFRFLRFWSCQIAVDELTKNSSGKQSTCELNTVLSAFRFCSAAPVDTCLTIFAK